MDQDPIFSPRVVEGQMTERYVEIETVLGRLQADILRSLLEAYGIPTELSQEAAGAATGINVGPMGEVRLLVPVSKEKEARQLLEDYYAGRLEEE
jgi:hypothetical protein